MNLFSLIKHKLNICRQCLEKLHLLLQTYGWRIALAKINKKLRQIIIEKGLSPLFFLCLRALQPIFPKISKDIPFSPNPYYYGWLLRNYPTTKQLAAMKADCEQFVQAPLFSIIMPVYNPPIPFLRQALDSILQQIYPHWQLCIADDASTNPEIRKVLEEYQQKDSRCQVVFRAQNGHISTASNSALAIATGEYVVLFDHDDLLVPHTLYRAAQVLMENPQVDLLYTDEDKVDEKGQLHSPYFKPDWSPEMFLSNMYTCHLGAYRRSLVEKIGGFRIGYEGSQDYDLMLRLTEQANQIIHIPEILYHWRIHEPSTAGNSQAKPYAFITGKKAIEDTLIRRNTPGKVESLPTSGWYRVRYEVQDRKKVSILLPTRDAAELVDVCLHSIFQKTTYPHFEVLLIDNGSQQATTFQLFATWKQKEPERFQLLPLDIPYHFPRLNNLAAKEARGDYLLFLNNDTEVISEDWLSGMLEYAQHPFIGAVGVKLLYPNYTIQHAGIVLGLQGTAGHLGKAMHRGEFGYFGRLQAIANCSAVTAACLMCRKQLFEEMNGFDEQFQVDFNDVDLCLRMNKKGYRTVFLPHIELFHHESKTRGKTYNTPEKHLLHVKEGQALEELWANMIENDPFLNPNLSRKYTDSRIRLEGIS